MVRSGTSGPTEPARLGFSAGRASRRASTPTTYSRSPVGIRVLWDAFDYPYPFGKYDQIFVPEFNPAPWRTPWGRDVPRGPLHLQVTGDRGRLRDARRETILHEMAHMWFGDLVTMTWWDDLWLNESFAEWAAHHSCPLLPDSPPPGRTSPASARAWAYRQGPAAVHSPHRRGHARSEHGLHQLRRHHLCQGRLGLRQLVAWVGEDNFLSGLRDYFAEHAYGNTTLTDLLAALSHASGRELDGWAAAWLQTSGVNLIRTEVGWTMTDAIPPSDCSKTHRRRRRGRRHAASAPPPVGALRPHRGRLKRRNSIELDLDGAGVQVDALIGIDQPDLLLINDDDLTFAKIRLDPRSLATAVDSIGTLDDPLARALLWGPRGT